jgi:signal transduction histidine kinase
MCWPGRRRKIRSVDRLQPVFRTWPARDVPWLVLDFAAAAVLVAVLVRDAATRAADFGVPTWLTLTAAVLVASPVAVRRVWPVTVLAVVLAANCVVAAAGVGGSTFVIVALALYTVAVSRPPRRSVPLLAVALVVGTAAVMAGVLASPYPPGLQVRFDVFAATIAVIAAGWALGAARRAQLLAAACAAQQATRRAVADERLRIARELHDVIAHSMSLITAKAAVANYLTDSQPDGVRDALTVIEDTGRHALAEMRRMLGALRSDTPERDPGGASGERAPAPGLPDLAVLAEHAEQAGVSVDMDVPDAADLPDGVALAAYRIVQEALTNVVKHAAPTSCRVHVARTGPEVLIDVIDAGGHRRSGPPAAGGHGIIGMRERAALFGGEFEAGPGPDGGFRVTARLPLAAADLAAPADRSPARAGRPPARALPQ